MQQLATLGRGDMPPKRKRPLVEVEPVSTGETDSISAPLQRFVSNGWGETLPPVPDIGPETLLVTYNGSVAMVWSSHDCARLRSLGRLCCSPVGLCAAKVATRGKAAAVPVVLNDEELYIMLGVCDTKWGILVVDSKTGRRLDKNLVMIASGLAQCSPTPTRDEVEAVLVRRLVFADLWRRGYRCTPGLKFGVDFLSYTADASQVHAGFMVIIKSEAASGRVTTAGDIAPMDLVAKSRVATTALKICVMAYGNVESSCSPSGLGSIVRGKTRFAAFKRMGPGHAIFTAAEAQPCRSAESSEKSFEGVRNQDAGLVIDSGSVGDEPGILSFVPAGDLFY